MRTPQFGFQHYSKSCLETHVGLWCVDDQWASQFLSYVQMGILQAYLAQNGPIAPNTARDYERGYDLYDSTAMVPLVGSLSPKGSKWGGGSTLEFRRGVRAATESPEVEKILAYINSPGGVVEGTYEAAQELRRAGEYKKTEARFQDMGASAAYWIGSQAQRITANPTAFVGNIGVRGAMVDTSKMFEMAGAKTYLFATGPYKAIGMPGVPVTEEQAAHIQGLIDDTFALFSADVAKARGLSGERLDAVLNGKTFISANALSAGLIDEVVDMDTLMGEGGSMADEHADIGKFQNFLSMFKLRVVPDEQAKAMSWQPEEGHTLEAVPLRTYEDGVREGVKAARHEAVEIIQLCMLSHKPDALSVACMAVQQGMQPQALRESLAAEIALRAEQDDQGTPIAEISTAHMAPTPKPQTTLQSAADVAAERDRMAANYGRNGQ